MALGIDYSDARPSHDAMKAVGIKFVMRYIGSKNRTATRDPKFITPSEYRSLKADGFEVGLVFETEANRADGGRTAGLEDAQTTKDELAWLGLSSAYPVYYAVDYDAEVGPLITAYFMAIGQIRGVSATGAYGGYKVIKALFDHSPSLIRLGWQTLAWSGGRWDPRAQLRQYKIDQFVGGQSVDLNQSMAADYGQKPASGTTNTTEDGMPFAGQLAPGKGSEAEISFPRGSLHALGLVYDNSLSIPEVGIEPQPTGVVRVAIHYKDGTHDVRDKVQVGVGVVDPKQPKKTFKTVEVFDNPGDVDYVILVRLDDGKRPIGWDMS